MNHRVCLEVEKMAGHTAGDPLECYGVSWFKLISFRKTLGASEPRVFTFWFSLMLSHETCRAYIVL